jgi:hypothetical protein
MLVICVALLKGGVSKTTTAGIAGRGRRADRGGVSPVSGSTEVARPPVIKDSGPLACTDVKPEMGRP